jgi:general secretion pathway protein G
LIELLVVIAIVVILAALIFPAFARAKAAAKQSTCLSNLKQIGSAIGLYMADYDDRFPHAVDASDKFRPQIWDDFPEFRERIPSMPLMNEVLQDYLKSAEVFRCPADNGTDVLDTHPYIEFKSAPSHFTTYRSSYSFRTEIAFRSFTHTQFELPADVNVLFDSSGHWHGATRRIRLGDDPRTIFDLLRGYRYSVLFGDLHVKSIPYARMDRAWQTRL